MFDFTLYVAHFGNTMWTIPTVNKFSKDSRIKEIVISDQIPPGKQIHHALSVEMFNSRNIKIIKTYPHEIDHRSLHHVHSIRQSIKMHQIVTSHLIISDSDCFPLDDTSSLIDQLIVKLESYDGIFALVSDQPDLNFVTHPCFMVVPSQIFYELDFGEFMVENWIDTGRLIGLRFIEKGLKPLFLTPRVGYGGRIGTLYFNDSIFHVGSGSAASSPHQIDSLRSERRLKFIGYLLEKYPGYIREKYIRKERWLLFLLKFAFLSKRAKRC